MRVRPFVLATLAALPLLAQAADSPVIASASVGLSNLTVQLIDLNPNDGIAPGIQFQTLGVLNTSQYGPDPETGIPAHYGPTYTNSLTPSASLSTTVGNTTSVATPTSLAIGTSTTLSQILDPNATEYTSQTYNSSFVTNGGTLSVEGPEGSWSNATFTLTPFTAVVITGNISGTISLDASALAPLLPADQYSFWRLSTQAYITSTSAYLALRSDSTIDDDQATGVGSATTDSSVSLALDNYYDSVSSSDDPSKLSISHSASKDFTLQYANLSDQAFAGELAAYLNAGASVALDTMRLTPGDPVDPGTPPVPGIPEPGTWALMSLGLAGLAWARRRHPRQA